jgi:hypothetical protein
MDTDEIAPVQPTELRRHERDGWSWHDCLDGKLIVVECAFSP